MSAPREVTVDLGFKPFAHQRAAHAVRLASRFQVLVWHRRAGKTVFAVMELLLAALQAKRERSRYAYVAPYQRQARDVAWAYLRHYARLIPGTKVLEVELAVELPNGARVRIYGADNPDSLRGLYFDGIVLDEVADMRPEVWGEIVRPALADRQGWATFIGTPKGVNAFSELYFRALKGEDGWAADLRRASETGVIPDAELASAKKEMTEAQYAQEMDCDFAAAVDDVLIRLDDVLAAQQRVLGEADYSYAAKVLGVDVARYGGDRCSLQPRQGLVAFKPRILRAMDLMTLAGHVCEYIDTWRPDATFIDLGGMGAGVVDRCLQLGHEVIGIDFGGKPIDARYENKRAEMWATMGAWVKTGCLPDMPELAQDLTAPRYTYANARGRLQLESKDDMRSRGMASPDVGDALALTFASPVAPRPTRLPGQQDGLAIGHDYNPFARSA